MSTVEFDVIVVGAGVAGASLAWRLAEHSRVAILDMERVAGYHSSGRSATYFNLGLGVPAARALSSASEAFFRQPPPGFSDHSLIESLPALTVTSEARADALQAYLEELREFSPEAHRVDAARIESLVPSLRAGREGIWEGVVDPRGCRLDGHGLLQGYLGGARQRGAQVFLDWEATSVARDRGLWRVDRAGEVIAAPVIVNAAGAWGDVVAGRAGVAPLGLQPKRRTIVVLEAPVGTDVSRWPFVRSLDDLFYFTGESGGILLSPADQTPVDPHDVQPDEFDVAVAIDRFETVSGLPVSRIRSRWAGLRSFVPDSVPVVGFEPGVPGFFWCVGQGGVGLQTSPAMSAAGAALIAGRELPEELLAVGLSAGLLGPQRFRSGATVDSPAVAVPA
jgi:D-arginine dehydrogenase